jgi:hypothetical protein
MPTALLLKTTGEVIPLELTNENDHEIIRESVGGWFDCVRNHERRIVGYVHDEGLLIGLPANPVSSFLFDQVLAGDCVIVGSFSEAGEYDGESHELPKAYYSDIFVEMARDMGADIKLNEKLNTLLAGVDTSFTVTEWSE